ncbi:MAG: DUF4438 domain-containing protein [Synechococcus sp.]
MNTLPNAYSKHWPRINRDDLVVGVVAGQIANPVVGAPYRIGHDGVPRVLPGGGGIAINQRIGDRCVGVAGDHIEPGVALHNNDREVKGSRQGPNLALMTYACIGNRVKVTKGPCTGQMGMVTGKHGGADRVLVDFPTSVLKRLQIGDRMQVYSVGLGLRLLDYPEITVMNCSPALLQRWNLRPKTDALQVPVTHIIPSALMGSGLGKNTAWRGDVDIQLFDRESRRRCRLATLRYGDLVAIVNGDSRFGPAVRQGRTIIGAIVHSDSSVSGHGPGVTPLFTGPSKCLRPIRDPEANLATLFKIRRLSPAKTYRPIFVNHRHRRSTNSIQHQTPITPQPLQKRG